MEKETAIQLVAKEVDLVLRGNEHALWLEELAEKINALLLADFGKLINILYRMDVSEAKLKQLLKDNPNEDAGKIIALLMIERQAEKIKSREQFGKRDDVSEDEKW